VIKESVIIFLFLFQCTALYSAGTTTANFLRIGVGARASAMAESYVAVADDVFSIYWNPAGLNKLKMQELGVSYNVWIEDISHKSVYYAYPKTAYGSFGAGITNLDMADIQGYSDILPDDPQHVTQVFSVGDSVKYFSYAQSLNAYTNIGVNFKYITQKLENYTANAVAFDFGLLINLFDKNVKIGFVMMNKGDKLKFKHEEGQLPEDIKFGFAKQYWNKKLIVSGDIVQPADRDTELRVGLEYYLLKLLFIRGGYRTGMSVGTGLSLGLGFTGDTVQLDYAILNYGMLGNVHQVSLIMRFEKNE